MGKPCTFRDAVLRVFSKIKQALSLPEIYCDCKGSTGVPVQTAIG